MFGRATITLGIGPHSSLVMRWKRHVEGMPPRPLKFAYDATSEQNLTSTSTHHTRLRTPLNRVSGSTTLVGSGHGSELQFHPASSFRARIYRSTVCSEQHFHGAGGLERKLYLSSVVYSFIITSKICMLGC